VMDRISRITWSVDIVGLLTPGAAAGLPYR
jgi:hypothetical protein